MKFKPVDGGQEAARWEDTEILTGDLTPRNSGYWSE